MKRGWSVAERFVGQTADDGIANDPVATAPTAPVISSVGPAFQNRLVPGDVLAGAGQIEGVESAECREVRGRESRLGHVEVFRMDCVRTSIIGRPRRLSAQRLAVSWNHRSTLSITKSHQTAQRPIEASPEGSAPRVGKRRGAAARPPSRDTSQPMPVPRAAIVLVRKDECAEVAKFISSGSRAILTADAKYLAAELTMHNQWHLVLESPVRINPDKKGYLLKSATIIPQTRRIKVILHPSDTFRASEIVTIPRFGIHEHLAKSPENVAVTILALIFDDVHNLRKSDTAADMSMANSHAWHNAISISAVYRFVHPVRWRATSQLIESSTKPHSASKRRPTDVRGSFRLINGVRYPVKPHRRRS